MDHYYLIKRACEKADMTFDEWSKRHCVRLAAEELGEPVPAVVERPTATQIARAAEDAGLTVEQWIARELAGAVRRTTRPPPKESGEYNVILDSLPLRKARR